MCYNLTPITREHLLPSIADNIQRDGWGFLYEIDYLKQGPNKIRNSLLNKAIILGATYVRFSDDDDLIMPHRERVCEVLSNPDIDVVYLDFIFDKNNKQCINPFTGDLYNDVMRCPGPWSFVAKVEALNQFNAVGNELFDPTLPCINGGFAFLKMIKAGLRFKYVPIIAYHWRREFDNNSVNKHPMADKLTKEVRKELELFFNQIN